jgi:phosphate transport system protein
MANLYAEDALLMPPGAPAVTGRPGIRTFLGDEAAKIARMAKLIHSAGKMHMPRMDLSHVAECAVQILRQSLDAFARLDVAEAMDALKKDGAVDDEFRAIMRQLITFMMEDPRTISASIDLIWVAKAIERIGDHAKNIAEHVIFISAGMDVRHATPDEVDRVTAQA